MATFAVITTIGEDGGNLALALDTRMQVGGDPLDTVSFVEWLKVAGVDPAFALHLRAAVFSLGEILILDGPHGREVTGRGRRPDKWDVGVEHFDDLNDAIKRAQAVEDAR